MKTVVVWARGHLPGPASCPQPLSSEGHTQYQGKEGACRSHSPPPEVTEDQRESADLAGLHGSDHVEGDQSLQPDSVDLGQVFLCASLSSFGEWNSHASILGKTALWAWHGAGALLSAGEGVGLWEPPGRAERVPSACASPASLLPRGQTC